MAFKISTVLLMCLFSQAINCVSRVEVRDVYLPTLLRLRDIANTKYQEALRDQNVLVSQLQRNQDRVKNATQTQINNIRNVIGEAQKSPNVTSFTSSCLKTQERTANVLSSSGINNCYSSSNVSFLNGIKSKFSTLASVAYSTQTWCSNLNPLESQLPSYRECLATKIPDLNLQINLVDQEFERLSSYTLQYNIRCLTETAGGILGRISTINYQINLCLFTLL